MTPSGCHGGSCLLPACRVRFCPLSCFHYVHCQAHGAGLQRLPSSCSQAFCLHLGISVAAGANDYTVSTAGLDTVNTQCGRFAQGQPHFLRRQPHFHHSAALRMQHQQLNCGQCPGLHSAAFCRLCAHPFCVRRSLHKIRSLLSNLYIFRIALLMPSFVTTGMHSSGLPPLEV